MRNKLVILSLLIFSFLSVMAQKPSLNRAYNAFANGDYFEAKELIDLCVNDPKLSSKALTYLYKGNIYLYLANHEYEKKRENESYIIQFPDAPVQAYDAFIKTQTMDKQIDAYNILTPDVALPSLYGLLYVYGVDELIAERYQSAKNVLEKAIYCYELKTPDIPLHGELYFYYAYTLENLKDPNALPFYEKALNDGSENPNLFLRLMELYKLAGTPEKSDQLFEKMKQVETQDPALYLAEIDYHFYKKDTVRVKKMLDEVPASVYGNPDLLVNIANFFIQLEEYNDAKSYLTRALQYDKENYIILYNLGVCYYYLSEEKFKEYNEMDYTVQMEEITRIKKESKDLLAEAEFYFEKVILKEPNDLNVLNILRSIYGRNDSPKYDDIVKKIESLENK